MPTNKSTTEMTQELSASISGFGLSYAITSILSALLVVIKESSEAVHHWLASITGHHWVTHGIIDVIVFLILGFVLYRMEAGARMKANTLITIIVGSTVISGLIISGYFI
ncbi:hypothetical protein [Kangiella koreensis]|uniref:Uncharacterized protein n=1 Tax=Kangiella koreensis (strain DSM 16069 / JCM 12317 / KCTC 12182 / SW-125) TaxID=523791 RepID=C7R675_KANKD|nr:hypothetical protein [Kangiella koreensis]ACV25506.1 conserved hypothetical protein [Kangiella koreensis DSM 16069]